MATIVMVHGAFNELWGPKLAEVFGGGVTDRLVDNGHRAHDPQPYLNNPATGQAVAEALARVQARPG